MQTWLDALANRTHRELVANIAARVASGQPGVRASLERISEKPMDRMSPLDSLRAVALKLSKAPFGADIGGSLARAVWPYVLTPADCDRVREKYEWFRLAPTRAVRVSPELVEDFRDAHAAPDLALAGERLAAFSWYLDIPHRSLTMGDGFQVRALFLQPVQSPGCDGACVAHAVITPPGSDRVAGAMFWSILDGRYGGEAVLDEVINTRVDPDVAAAELTEFLRLVALYDAVAEPAARTEVPHIAAASLVGCRKAAQKAKRFSMFRVVDLGSPRGRFGRTAASRGSSRTWSLGHRVTVRGHFRMQAHGEGRALRKLIWVEAFQRGPKDSAPDTRHDLHVLRPTTVNPTADAARELADAWERINSDDMVDA